jgi:hypothetical protein
MNQITRTYLQYPELRHTSSTMQQCLKMDQSGHEFVFLRK